LTSSPLLKTPGEYVIDAHVTTEQLDRDESNDRASATVIVEPANADLRLEVSPREPSKILS
jgi:hypothetical protein